MIVKINQMLVDNTHNKTVKVRQERIFNLYTSFAPFSKEEIEIFMNAQAEIIEYIENNYDETMDIVAKELDLDRAAVEEMYKQYDFSIETTDADVKAFQNVADFMLNTGMIENEVNVEDLFIK